MDITTRALQKNDIDNLVKTFCFPWSSVQATIEKWTCYFAEQQNQMRTVYLLEQQGQGQSELIGYASLLRLSQYSDFRNANIPEIHDVWISEKFRNRGFGKKLVLHLEGIAHKEGYKQIGLGVGLYRDYGQAQKLYFRLGYAPDGKGITYKGKPVTSGEVYPRR